MSAFVGILLILIAGGTIIGVLTFVMREQHEHEEHYIPTGPKIVSSTDAPTINEISAEAVGTEFQPSATATRRVEEDLPPSD